MALSYFDTQFEFGSKRLSILVAVACAIAMYFIFINPLQNLVSKKKLALTVIEQQYAEAKDIAKEMNSYNEHVLALRPMVTPYLHYDESVLAQSLALNAKQNHLIILSISPYISGQTNFVKVNLEGDYISLMRFLYSLRELPVLLDVNELNIQSSNDHLQSRIHLLIEVVGVHDDKI